MIEVVIPQLSIRHCVGSYHTEAEMSLYRYEMELDKVADTISRSSRRYAYISPRCLWLGVTYVYGRVLLVLLLTC